MTVLRHFGTGHFADDPLLTPQHFDILTERHFDTLTFCRRDILPPGHCVAETFCHPDIMSPRHLDTSGKKRHSATQDI